MTAKNDHTIWSNRSYAYYMLQDYEQALSDATHTVKLRPQWAKVRVSSRTTVLFTLSLQMLVMIMTRQDTALFA